VAFVFMFAREDEMDELFPQATDLISTIEVVGGN
jgi:hypothetical protein